MCQGRSEYVEATCSHLVRSSGIEAVFRDYVETWRTPPARVGHHTWLDIALNDKKCIKRQRSGKR